MMNLQNISHQFATQELFGEVIKPLKALRSLKLMNVLEMWLLPTDIPSV